MRLTRFPSFVLVVLIACLAVACDSIRPPARDTTAKDIMPKPSGYNIVDTAQYRSQVANLIAAGAAGTGQLQVSAGVVVADRVAGCFQTAGAYEAQFYINTSNPLLSGAVVVINKSVLANPQTLLGCLNPSRPPGVDGVQAVIDPCVTTFETTKNNQSLLVTIAGTNPTVCTLLCSATEGCPAAGK
jgi:hypothetical protein